MKKIIKNARSGIRTTIMGIVLFNITVIYVFLPMYLMANNPEFHYEIDTKYVAGGIIGSIVLIIMPDTFKGALKKFIGKKV